MLLSIVCLAGGYIVGSLPTAYLVVKQKTGVDIRGSGSGNVGGFNAFQVTNSKSIGYAVGILDGLKGLVAVLLVGYFLGENFWLKSMGLFGSVIGHNYPVWLRFKGGRGLATACGGLFLLGVGYTVIWCTMWVLIYRLKRDILFANVLCILATPLILAGIPDSGIQALMVVSAGNATYLQFSAILSLILLLSHVDIIKNILKSKTS